MPASLIIEWRRGGCLGLEAEVTGGRSRVRRCFRLTWPDGLDPLAEPVAAGEWLAAELDRRKIAARECSLLFGRDDVVTRLCRLPAAGDDTLPELVRFQAAARSAVPLDQLSLDFVVLPSWPAGTGHAVLMATVANTLLDAVRSTASAAGLMLVSAGYAPLAAANVIGAAERRRGIASGAASLAVALLEERCEILLLRAGRLLASHTAGGPRREPRDIWAAVQRVLLAHEGDLGDDTISQAWVLGGNDPQPLAAELARRLDCHAEALDVAAELSGAVQLAENPEQPVEYLGALGTLLAGESGSGTTIDFLHPRRAAVRPDRTRLYAAIAGAAVLAVILLAYGGARMVQGRLAERIADRQQQQEQLDAALTAGRPALELHEVVAGWSGRQINWLETLQQLGEALPGTERVYLDRWSGAASPGGFPGTIQADGQARERSDVQDLHQRLADQQRFRIRPNALRAAAEGSSYPVEFQLDADVLLSETTRDPATPSTGQ